MQTVFPRCARLSLFRPLRTLPLKSQFVSLPFPQDLQILFRRTTYSFLGTGEGNARTGLKRKCAAVAGWQAVIEVKDLGEIVGTLPNAVIAELLTKIAATLAESPEENPSE